MAQKNIQNNGTKRESMVFYRSFFEAIHDLPTDEKVVCYDTILNYGLNGIQPDLESASITEKMTFLFVKDQIDANNRRYENGKKGGAPKGNTNASKFVPPTLEEVAEYIKENDYTVDAEEFHAYYESNGWMHEDGSKVVNWKALIDYHHSENTKQ